VLLLVLQQTATSIQQQRVPKSSIEGTVVRVGTAEPVPGARVTVTRTGSVPSEAISVSADFQGRFIINDLDAGTFLMEVAANGYARQEYGQRFAGEPRKLIDLATGQSVKNVVIELTPAGYVNGSIRDNAGSPAAGLLIQLFRVTYNARGQRVLRGVGSTTTNDRGEYRLYWVTPGRYYLTARSAERASFPFFDQASPNAVQERYALTYYPGVLDVQDAASIDVQPGVNLTTIDFTVTRQQLYEIRGRVIDSRSGQWPRAVAIKTLSESATGESEMIAFSNGAISRGLSATYNATDGTFEIRNVVPGSYVVQADILGVNQDARPDTVLPSASASVVVSNSDINGLMLNILPAVSISGHLTIEGRDLSTMQNLQSIRVRLIPADRLARLAVPNSPQSQTLNPDGTFRLDNVKPGQYQVLVCMAAPCIRDTPDFYLKDARFDHTDVLNGPLQFAGIAPTPLDIMLSPKPGRIEGVVVNDKRQPVGGIRTILIPDQNRDRIGLYKFAETDQSGRFTIRGVAPGVYKVFAWEALEEFAYFDPDLMRRFEPYGTRIRVSESDELQTEVKLIPAEM